PDLAEPVGTSIEGIDLADEHDAEMVAILRAACVERTLLLFRGQQALSPAAYLGFAQRFGGRPDLHSLRHYCLPEHHEIFVVGNVHEKQASVGSPRWPELAHRSLSSAGARPVHLPARDRGTTRPRRHALR